MINKLLSFQIHSGSEHEGIASRLDIFLAFLDTLSGKSLTEIFGLILPGVTVMENIHPLVVHFPIALLINFFVVDFLGSVLTKDHWRRVASGFLYLGTFSALCAVLAGFIAEKSIAHGGNVHEIMETHQLFGLSILFLAILLSGWRFFSGGVIKGEINIFYMMLSGILSALIVIGADMGGLMVYKYGVSVEAVKINSKTSFQEHQHNH